MEADFELWWAVLCGFGCEKGLKMPFAAVLCWNLDLCLQRVKCLFAGNWHALATVRVDTWNCFAGIAGR